MPADATIIIVDDNDEVRRSLRALLESAGLLAQSYSNAAAFLAEGPPASAACLIVDIMMPGMNGLELQQELNRRNIRVPLVVLTGHGDVELAVKAMKAGAIDFMEKPYDDEELLVTIRRVVEEGRRTQSILEESTTAACLIASLSKREAQVLELLTLGQSNKLIAYHLGISARTVEIHRAHLQKKLNARGVSDLMRTLRAAEKLNSWRLASFT